MLLFLFVPAWTQFVWSCFWHKYIIPLPNVLAHSFRVVPHIFVTYLYEIVLDTHIHTTLLWLTCGALLPGVSVGVRLGAVAGRGAEGVPPAARVLAAPRPPVIHNRVWN